MRAEPLGLGIDIGRGALGGKALAHGATALPEGTAGTCGALVDRVVGAARHDRLIETGFDRDLRPHEGKGRLLPADHHPVEALGRCFIQSFDDIADNAQRIA